MHTSKSFGLKRASERCMYVYSDACQRVEHFLGATPAQVPRLQRTSAVGPTEPTNKHHRQATTAKFAEADTGFAAGRAGGCTTHTSVLTTSAS